MSGQEAVMQQLSSLLQKANAGVDQAIPILVKQIQVEKIEAVAGIGIGLALLFVAGGLAFSAYRFCKERKRDWDDPLGRCMAAGLFGIVGSLAILFSADTLLQLTLNPMYCVLQSLLHP